MKKKFNNHNTISQRNICTKIEFSFPNPIVSGSIYTFSAKFACVLIWVQVSFAELIYSRDWHVMIRLHKKTFWKLSVKPCYSVTHNFSSLLKESKYQNHTAQKFRKSRSNMIDTLLFKNNALRNSVSKRQNRSVPKQANIACIIFHF